ncbi:MAG: apolipoprotein N-acyltransferase, partial [Terriglobus roseus]|nr:apolipoprotein N-acyltransferase [Terriglobus roseus]
NAIIAVGLAELSLRRKNYKVELTSGVVLAGLCVLLGLAVRAPLPAATTNAILVQPNLSGEDDADTEPRSFARPVPLERQLAALTTDVAQRTSGLPVRLVLWPEAPTSYEMHEPNLQTVLTTLAAEEHVTVIADANSVDSDPSVPRRYRIYNAAGLFTATGLHARYDKIHLVPFGEFMPFASLFSFASGLTQQVGLFDRGTRRFPLSDGQHRYGVFICYESIFPDEVRELALRGAEVFANLSDDGWYGDTSAPFQHSNMARMRAIENRRWLLRDTNTGITESIDPYGNVRGVAPRHQRLAVALPFAYRSDLTFYTRHGDIFAWLCAALTAFAIGAGAVGSNGTAEERALTS